MYPLAFFSLQEPGVDQLKTMFPNIPEENLVHAMLKSENF